MLYNECKEYLMHHSHQDKALDEELIIKYHRIVYSFLSKSSTDNTRARYLSKACKVSEKTVMRWGSLLSTPGSNVRAFIVEKILNYLPVPMTLEQEKSMQSMLAFVADEGCCFSSRAFKKSCGEERSSNIVGEPPQSDCYRCEARKLYKELFKNKTLDSINIPFNL